MAAAPHVPAVRGRLCVIIYGVAHDLVPADAGAGAQVEGTVGLCSKPALQRPPTLIDEEASVARILRVTVWNEYREERNPKWEMSKVYPYGIHRPLLDYLEKQPDIKVRLATLDDVEHGLTEDVLAATDVLTWYGHVAHDEVKDEIVDRVYRRVLDGMGLIALHSSHFSKIFKKLMGTECVLKWREAGEKERIWTVEPGHPIADGLPPYFEIEHEEMYGERFDIPKPDDVVFISWFAGGEVFRSGCTFTRGKGKIFYWRPGHGSHPTFYQPEVLQVIANAARWAAPPRKSWPVTIDRMAPIEKLDS